MNAQYAWVFGFCQLRLLAFENEIQEIEKRNAWQAFLFIYRQ